MATDSGWRGSAPVKQFLLLALSKRRFAPACVLYRAEGPIWRERKPFQPYAVGSKLLTGKNLGGSMRPRNKISFFSPGLIPDGVIGSKIHWEPYYDFEIILGLFSNQKLVRLLPFREDR